ncbi:MAG: hypothetical protein OXN88_08975 [Chloroflexota bacterium]|nr:hypothetical protein [Chloroflexota bacterium]
MAAEKMTRWALNAAVAFGALLALFGLGIDYLLPGASPGLNLPQLLIIAAGLALALGALLLSRPGLRPRASGRPVFSAAIVIGVTLLLLELLLTAAGIATYFFSSPPGIVVRPVDWWVCAAPGCHYEYEKAMAACQDGRLSGRHCRLNRQGFADSQDFIAPPEAEARYRILALGDSFTFGMSADAGLSFVEILESRNPQALVWNAGMPGTGTHQAVASFKHFAPQLRPELTILGFYMNDFADNLLPIDRALRALDPENRIASVNYHFYDTWGNVFATDKETALRYYGHAVGPPRSRVEHAIGTTRLGTLLLRLRDALGRLSGALPARQTEATRGYLADLRDLAQAHGSDLLVLVIPHRADIAAPGDEFRAAIRLLGEEGIPYLNPVQSLNAPADYMEAPNNHWNSAGHQKAGALLSGCVEKYLVTKSLADCENVVMPTRPIQ